MSELDDFSAPISAAPVAIKPSSPLDGFSMPASTAQQKASVFSNSSPDEAGKALSISKKTGIPASIVQTDLPGYDAHAKTQAAIQAVQNPAIAKYIDENRMAPQVSNDDYGHMDEVSQYFENLKQDQIHAQATGGIIRAIPEIAALTQTAPGREKLLNALTQLPGAIGKGILDFLQTPGKVASGEINLNTPEGLDKGIGFGLGIALGSRDIRVGRTADLGPVAPTSGNVDDFLAKVRGAQTRQEINDFIKSKATADTAPKLLEGPKDLSAGATPIDELWQTKLNEAKANTAGEALDSAIEASQESTTKERSPELYERFIEAHGDTGTVHVPAQAILDLYQREGKVPIAGDGLFGFVPGLADKATLAAETGAEVAIPMPKYIANVDPTVHEGLKDVVRVHPDGVTREEAKLAKEKAPIEESKFLQPTSDEPIVKAAVEQAVKEKKSLYLEPLFKNGEALDITQPEFKRYSDLIDRGQEAVLTKAVALTKRETVKRLTPEWRANETRVSGEVENEITQSPTYLADRYFNFDKGMLPNGKRIISDAFKPLDLAMADEWAPIFGFESGSDMSTAIVAREQARTEAGKGPKWQLRQEIEAETAKRMEAQYGNLADNIALEASEAALAEWNVDLLATEWKMLAKLNGRDPPLSREQLKDWSKDQFDKSTASQVSYEQWRRSAEKGGREAEKAFLKKDFEEAFIAKQHQMLSLILAKETKVFEKEKARIDSKIDRFTSEQVIKSIDQTHLEQIRSVLESVGIDQRYGPSTQLEPIQNFVADSEGQIAIAPWLRGELPEGVKKVPSVDDMTVQQFRDLGKSLQSMEHVGRFAKTLSNARGAAELQNVIFDVKAELNRFNFIDQPMNPSKNQRLTSLGRKVTGAHLLVERMFDYTDQFDPHGPITEYLDRPLRDSNVKELVLTEQVTKKLRDLRQHTDVSVNDKIENDLIPDAMDKSGFANMRRTNLRQLMLYTGDRVRMAKISEGFGVNEADVRRFIDKHATAADVAWVNGVWDIFAGLKPEADAMQVRDTGVPFDSTPAVPWEVKAGKLTGGYYPIVYDKANSNIQGHLAAKNPVFDQHYVQATTPHGYTQSVTEFKGALDLSGSFLPSRIQGMIHDIAFREAIRNANKLISNQEFRTALAQKWGQEYSDLLPSWLKDIANSHTLDDDYAQGFVRGMALVRQNVISTLIAYNPGTFIKHGFTALLLSMDRVGGVAFTKALSEIGLKGAGETAKNLVSREDRVPDEAFMDSFRDTIDQGERGENARKFVLDSSAVMRNRQRQADDSIRGAVDRMNKAGWGQSFMNLRDQQMMLGRFMVAFSDGLSAYPTWLAAYKKAYMAGEEHADAVFIADKEVSRAHGSNFVGDQPLVTRIKNGPTGELARWFVPLYKFWNHMVNNNFQLAWDSAAALRGPAEGVAPEPGANAWAISRRVGLIMATIFIEEQASAAKDEDHHGFLTKMALASLRYFGSGFVGARELTNGLASGYEPSTGLLGTLGKGINDTINDLKRATGLKAGVAKNWIIHTATALGYLTGIGGTQLGKTGQFTKDLATKQELPFGGSFNDYRQGFRTGHSKARIH